MTVELDRSGYLCGPVGEDHLAGGAGDDLGVVVMAQVEVGKQSGFLRPAELLAVPFLGLFLPSGEVDLAARFPLVEVTNLNGPVKFDEVCGLADPTGDSFPVGKLAQGARAEVRRLTHFLGVNHCFSDYRHENLCTAMHYTSRRGRVAGAPRLFWSRGTYAEREREQTRPSPTRDANVQHLPRGRPEGEPPGPGRQVDV